MAKIDNYIKTEKKLTRINLFESISIISCVVMSISMIIALVFETSDAGLGKLYYTTCSLFWIFFFTSKILGRLKKKIRKKLEGFNIKEEDWYIIKRQEKINGLL